MRKNKKNIFLLLLPIYLIFLFISLYLVNINQTQKINITLEQNLQRLKINYQMFMHNQEIRANSFVDSVFEESNIKDIMIKANKIKNKENLKPLREKLYKKLKKRYDILLKDGVLQFHIVLPNNYTLLRMHKPSKFDDNLNEVRKDMKWVQNTKKPLYGFNQGKTSHSFKHIIPLFDKENYLGLVDIAYTSSSLQKYLNDVSKIHTHFLVNKNIFSVKAWENDKVKAKYSLSIEHKDYMVSGGVHKGEKKYYKKLSNKLKNKIKRNISLEKEFVLYNKNNLNKANVIAFYPIRSTITKKTSAWIVSYEQNKTIKLYDRDKNIIFVIVFIMISFIFIVIYRAILQKEILNDLVKVKTEKLSNINEMLITSEEELTNININLENTIKKEVQKNLEVQEQLFNAQQLMSMGEMIGNIAHQWRQPLSVITSQATSIQIQKECGILENDFLINSCKSITKNAKYLSKTIDDFRNFIKGDQEKEIFSLNDNMQSLLSLISPIIIDNKIKLITNFDDVELNSYPNELNQCLINIINNAKDALLEIEEEKRFIFINTYIYDDKINIRIKDSANGIDPNIINKIFNPYFTTKHKSQGTGLGLNMTYNILTKHLNGDISVKNVEFSYENNTYKGAEFIVNLDL